MIGKILWFTGLPGSGKTTITTGVAYTLRKQRIRVEVLDGDRIRKTISKDLGYSKPDRDENIRRIGREARRLARQGAVVLVAAITPYSIQREEQAQLSRKQDIEFHLVYVHVSLVEAVRRDPKGLYKKARAGIIKNFTGISDPYEVPDAINVKLDTNTSSINDCVLKALEVVYG